LFGFMCVLALGLPGCGETTGTGGGGGGEAGSGGVFECQNAGDCNDGNGCTEDSCTESGRCQYEPVENGEWCCLSWAWTGITYCCVDAGHCTDGACR
jgi:hypothetical protein